MLADLDWLLGREGRMWIITLLSSLVSTDTPDITYNTDTGTHIECFQIELLGGEGHYIGLISSFCGLSNHLIERSCMLYFYLSINHPHNILLCLIGESHFDVDILKTWSPSSWSCGKDLVENCLIYKMFHLHLN